MNPIPQPTDPHETGDQLSPEVQRATDAVRNEPVPQDAVDRATERASAIPKLVPGRSNGLRNFLIAAYALAAALVVAVGMWAFGLYPGANRSTETPNGPVAQREPSAEPELTRLDSAAKDSTNTKRDQSAFTEDPASAQGTTPKKPDSSRTNVKPTMPFGDGGFGGGGFNGGFGGGTPSGVPGAGGNFGGGGRGAGEGGLGPVPSGETATFPGRGAPVKETPQNPGFGRGTGGDSGSPAVPPSTTVAPGISAPSTPGGLPGGQPVGSGGGTPSTTPINPVEPTTSPRPTDQPSPLPLPTGARPTEGKDAKGEHKQGQGGPGKPAEGKPGQQQGQQGRQTAQLEAIVKSQEQVKALTENLSNLPAKHREAIRGYLQSVETAKKAGQPLPPPPPAIANVPIPEGIGAESYNHYHDNPYQAVSQKPLSTFSIAVDTASYSNVRRFLTQEKRLPPADAVRIAELVNYFPYSYKQPTGEHPITIAADIAQCPWQSKHHLLRVALKAKEYTPGNMPPRNFVFLIDTSGSMSSQNKLPLVKQSLKMLVETLNDSDRVAIATYAGRAGLVLPSTPGEEKDKILGALDRLGAGGSTNGGAGIELAYNVAQENFVKGGLNRVILCTDGDFNVGVTGAPLVRLIEAKRKTGVYLSILGFGMGNYKSGMMEQLAKHGNGTHGYIDTPTEAKKLFVEQGGALVTVAKDVKLQLEFNPNKVAGYRLIGYENRILQDQDFNDDTKDASEMGAGHTVTALYEIVPAGLPVPDVDVDKLKYQKSKEPTEKADSGEWLTVKLRYKEPEEEQSKKLEHPLKGEVVAFDKSPVDLRFAASVASFGMLLRKSEYAGNTTFAATKEIAESSLGDDPNGHRKAFVELVEAADKLTKPE